VVQEEPEKAARLYSFDEASREESLLEWFKDSAKEHIAKMHALKQILEAHGVVVDVIQTHRPGYVVYEDEFQVAAEPFSETVT
jgi:hypothetical protein